MPDAVGAFLYGRAAQKRLAKGGPRPTHGERYEFMPKGGVAWPSAGEPLNGDVNAGRLRALLSKLDGTGEQIERRETLRREADELSEAAGSRQMQQRYSFQPTVGVSSR